jgi:hypothetical protein
MTLSSWLVKNGLESSKEQAQWYKQEQERCERIATA